MRDVLKTALCKNPRGRCLYSTKFIDLGDINNKKVLDIGCGFGWFEVFTKTKEIKKIVGLDVSIKTINRNRKLFNDSRVSFKLGGANEIPFSGKTFNTVVSWEVIEHIPKNTENVMLKEVYRVLDDKGVFYLSTPDTTSHLQ